jgi:hypothetical protein
MMIRYPRLCLIWLCPIFLARIIREVCVCEILLCYTCVDETVFMA